MELTCDPTAGHNYGRQLVLKAVSTDRVTTELQDQFGGFLVGLDVGWNLESDGPLMPDHCREAKWNLFWQSRISS